MDLKAYQLRFVTLVFALATACVAHFVTAQPGERVVTVVAERFQYTPAEIRVRKGEPVVLEFTTRDVTMGFNAPELGVRADIVPGQVARVRLVPDKAGTFTFYCDIFCGSGHEEMTGTIVVTEGS